MGQVQRRYKAQQPASPPLPTRNDGQDKAEASGRQDRAMVALYCESCAGYVGNAAAMTRHARAVHRSVEMIVCGGCGGLYGSHDDLLIHAEASEEMYQARKARGILDETSSESEIEADDGAGPSRRRENQGDDFGDDAPMHPCDKPGCNKIYELKSSLRRHKKAAHGEKGGLTLSCDRCDRGFLYPYQLSKHRTTCKTCKLCDATFPSAVAYKAHVEACKDLCEKNHARGQASASAGGQRRRGKAQGAGIFKCKHKGCAKVYRWRRNLRRHLADIHRSDV